MLAMQTKLQRQDIREPRPKCQHCGNELTYAEYLYCDGFCIFHAEGGLTALKNLSKIAYIRLLLGDLAITKGKLRMKDRGLTNVDYQATVNTVKEDLRFIDNLQDMSKLVKAMKGHTGKWQPI